MSITITGSGTITGLANSGIPDATVMGYVRPDSALATTVDAMLDEQVSLLNGMPIVLVSTTSQLATSHNHYVLTNVNTSTLILPPSPTAGMVVYVSVDNGKTTNLINRNGQTIMGIAENMTIDVISVPVGLRFINNTWRLI